MVWPVHLPAHHGWLVGVKVDGATIENDVLFKSAQEDLAKHSLSIEDAIIGAQNSECFTLAIRNYNSTPIDLTTDEIIGTLVQEATLIEPHKH